MAGRVQQKDLERLSTAVAARRDDALAAWSSAVRDIARARGGEPALLDLGPSLFGHLLEDPRALELPAGVDPAQIVEELALMRDAFEPLPRSTARTVGRAVRELQRVAVEQLAAAQQQETRALERMLGASDHEALLAILLESASAIDSCALYTMRGGLLRIAAAGLARELPATADALVQLAVRRGSEAAVRDASTEPQLEGSAVAAAGLRALTALPLAEAGTLAGVLEAGSRTAFEFGRLDQLLLRAAAARAGPLLAAEAARRTAADLEQRLAVQHELEQELRQSEALKGAILSSALDAFVAVDAARRIVEWNASAERTFGWRREEVLGRVVADVIVPERLRDTEADALRDAMATDGGGRLGRHFEMFALHRDGREFPAELSVTRIEGHAGPLFTIALRDITERKRAERAARRVTQTFQALVESSPLPIVAHDADGRVLIWNRAAEELTGWHRSEVLGEPDPFLPPDARLKAQSLGANGTPVVALEVQRPRKDGSLVDVSVSLAPLRIGRRAPPGTIAIAADITQTKRAEGEAAEAGRFREQFVGIVGHDLRNPLSAIVSAAQLLLRHGGLSERQARTVLRILSSAERMTRMIADLLDFTRSRLGGGFPIHTRRMNLRELCEAVIEELELAYPERTIEFEARGDAWGNWDADRMAQVLSNIVGNALQHSPENSTVRVDLRDDGERIVLETSNAGPPIPRDVLPHLFEPGRRGAPGRGRNESSGLGLGLYIVRQIVLAHGGDIAVRSSATEGTTVTVALPRRSRAMP